MTTVEQWVGASALVGAASTIVGTLTLVLFLSRGDPWGKLNDASSVVLMLSMVPVAQLLAVIEGERVGAMAFAVAAVGIAAMLLIAVLQGALVVGRVTYDQTKAAVLGSGAVVGLWYVLMGAWLGSTQVPSPLAPLAIAAGIGFIAIGYGFVVGNERHPASVAGGLVLFLSSTAFLGWLGIVLVEGGLVVSASNA